MALRPTQATARLVRIGIFALVAIFAPCGVGAQQPPSGDRPAVSLAPVAVKASRLTEFEERRRLGKGRFITRRELEKEGHRKLGEVVARLPGLRIQRYGTEASAVTGRGSISLGKASNPNCYVHVYVDDAPVSSSVGQDYSKNQRPTGAAPMGVFNLNSLATTEIEAVEYYAGGASVPSKYNRTGSACGVLLLWTRAFAQSPP